MDYTAKRRAKKQEEARLEEVRSDKKRREALKTAKDYVKEAQMAFNRYIRERDKGKTCICCDRPLGTAAVGGDYDAGHYRSTGSAPHLRFNEHNCHGQLKFCNRYRAGNAVDYRIGLIKRIGIQAVETLESNQTIQKWTVEELIGIRDYYKAKLKKLLDK